MNKAKVLVVDDDPIILEILKKGLELTGYEVTTAEHYAEVKTALDQFKPEVILMDVSMPEIDGITLCRDIKMSSGSVDIPIIMITAFSDGKTFHDAMLFGATDYITKPFEINDVKTKIERALDKTRKKRENKP